MRKIYSAKLLIVALLFGFFVLDQKAVADDLPWVKFTVGYSAPIQPGTVVPAESTEWNVDVNAIIPGTNLLQTFKWSGTKTASSSAGLEGHLAFASTRPTRRLDPPYLLVASLSPRPALLFTTPLPLPLTQLPPLPSEQSHREDFASHAITTKDIHPQFTGHDHQPHRRGAPPCAYPIHERDHLVCARHSTGQVSS